MPPPHERRWPRIAVGYTILLLVLAGITAFAFETAGAAYQPRVLRLAVALLLGVVLLHIRSYFRGDPLWDPPSAFENALVRERIVPKFDASLVKLRGELADSIKSRAYFDRVLWPRLGPSPRRMTLAETKSSRRRRPGFLGVGPPWPRSPA